MIFARFGVSSGRMAGNGHRNNITHRCKRNSCRIRTTTDVVEEVQYNHPISDHIRMFGLRFDTALEKVTHSTVTARFPRNSLSQSVRGKTEHGDVGSVSLHQGVVQKNSV